MGYITRYTLNRVEQSPASECPTCHQMKPGWQSFHDAVKGMDDGYDPFAEPCKWYEHETHIVAAMVDTGTTVVEIHGEGEEQGDVWDKTFTRTPTGVDIATAKYELKPSTVTTTKMTTTEVAPAKKKSRP